MDPNSVDSSLQKTSPELDPAAVYRLSTEVSAQANMLVAHQQQLARLTSLTEELVTTLRASRLSPSESAPPPPPVNPAPQAPPQSHSMASPRLAYPEKFDGTPAKCKGFLLQCSLFVSQQPVLYPTEESRIAFLCSLLTGKALDWVTAVWNFNRPTFTSFESFFAALSSGFWSPWGRRWSRWTDPHIETREKYSSGVCSGFSHTGCTNWMAWWPFKAAFSQGIELGVTDWTRLSRRGKNFGSTYWSGHSHRQYDSL